MGKRNQAAGLIDDDMTVDHYGKDEAALKAYLAKQAKSIAAQAKALGIEDEKGGDDESDNHEDD